MCAYLASCFKIHLVKKEKSKKLFQTFTEVFCIKHDTYVTFFGKREL